MPPVRTLLLLVALAAATRLVADDVSRRTTSGGEVVGDGSAHSFDYLMDAAPGSSATDGQFTVFLDIQSITREGRYLICTTDGPHRLLPGDTVSIWGAAVGTSFDNPYNGAFRVEYLVYDEWSRLVPNKFYIGLDTVPASNPTGSIHWATQNSTPLRREIQTDVHGNVVIRGVFTSDKPAADGQTLFPVLTPGRTLVSLFGAIINRSFLNTYDMFSPYNNVVIVEDATRRSFRFRVGLLVRGDPGANAAGSPVCALAVATPLMVENTAATFTTVLKHGFVPGECVKLEDPDPEFRNQFTGFFAIRSVPSDTSFAWDYLNTPGSSGPPGCFSAVLWRVGQNIVERNIIELGQAEHPETGFGFSVGIYSAGPDFTSRPGDNFTPLYEYPRVIVRENLVSSLPTIPNFAARATTIQSAENVLVEKNLVDMPSAYPPYRLFDSVTQPAHYFGNREPLGEVIKAYNFDAKQSRDDLSTKIEDALLFSLL